MARFATHKATSKGKLDTLDRKRRQFAKYGTANADEVTRNHAVALLARELGAVIVK